MTRPCFWPHCKIAVPAAMLMCRKHWFTTPKHLRDDVWEHYRPGQEHDGKHSAGYTAALAEIAQWIHKRNAPRKPPEQLELLL